MKPEAYNWIRKRFKKNKVWVAADPDGIPLNFKNKALIKYQLDQEHEYLVKPESLFEIPKEAAAPPASSKNGAGRVKKRRKTRIAASSPETESATDDPAHDDHTIVIFTDGASSGNPGPSGIGVFMRYRDNEREISKYIGNATNNIAELGAIETALSEMKRTDLPVRLYTDSSYACGLLVNGWNAKKNIDLVNRIRQLMAKFSDLKIIKVKGHSGLAGNERADQLATSAITRQDDSA
jgi:ribonuclease HI